jgi:predicted metal-binding transcription factor (methanogenesis marker protein 9)
MAATNSIMCDSEIEYLNMSDKRYLSYGLKITKYLVKQKRDPVKGVFFCF